MSIRSILLLCILVVGSSGAMYAQGLVETEIPRIYIGDLDFGTIGSGQSRTLKLGISNVGDGFLTFDNLNGDSVIAWLDKRFTISQVDLDRVRQARIGADSTLTIDVTFRAVSPGTYRTVGRFWANTREHRDTSIWMAWVLEEEGTLSVPQWLGKWVVRSSTNCSKNPESSYPGVIVLTNSGDADFEFVDLTIVGPDASAFEIDNSNGSYVMDRGRRIRPGDSAANSLYQKINFVPTEERSYDATVIVTIKHLAGNRLDTLRRSLIGSGQGIHVNLFGADFKTVGADSVSRGSYLIAGEEPRSVTITDIRITGRDSAEFRFPADFVKPTPDQPLIINKVTGRMMPIELHPTSPGRKLAMIEISGNFDCTEDSLAPVIANVVGTSSIREDAGASLVRVDPNPIASHARFRFSLSRSADVRIVIVDTKGSEVARVADRTMTQGDHELLWNAEGVASGSYRYSLIVDDEQIGSGMVMIVR